MNIIQVAQMIMTGTFELVPEQTRRTILKTIVDAQRRVVKFENNTAECPICSMFKLISGIKVRSTQGENRYCECIKCGCTFVAIGEKFQKQIQEPDLLDRRGRVKKKRK